MKKITALLLTLAISAAMLLTGCSSGQTVKGTIEAFNGLTIQVKAEDGTVQDFELTDDTELDADHQPVEGDPIEIQYKEEDGKNIALKATVKGEG